MTRRHCLTAVAAAATFSLAGAALAQENANASASGSSSNAKSARDVTCAELSTMDTATVPGVLYFVAGYSEGERTTMLGQHDTTGGSDTADEGSSAETAASSNDSSQDATADATTSTDASSDSNGSQVQIGRMTGYFDIPVEEIVIACEAAPDRRLGDVLNDENERQSGMSSGETDNSTGSVSDSHADAGAETALEAGSDDVELTDDFRTYPALISRMRAHASVDFPAANEEVPVVIVRVSELGGDSTKGSADLKAEVAAQGENLGEIRAALEANENIKKQLEAEDISAEAVVAISREVNGTLLVYVDDTASHAEATPSS